MIIRRSEPENGDRGTILESRVLRKGFILEQSGYGEPFALDPDLFGSGDRIEYRQPLPGARGLGDLEEGVLCELGRVRSNVRERNGME